MNNSILKALTLLDYFLEKPEISLTELTNMSGMTKATVFRFISTLEECHLLSKAIYSKHDVRYKLGLKFLDYAAHVQGNMEFRKLSLPHMRRLNDEINETVHLAIRDGLEAVYIEKIDSRKHLRIVSKVGRRCPLYASSGPKLLLAFLEKEEMCNVINQMNFERFTPNTITDKEELRKELEKVKKDGYSTSDSERYPETKGFSYPILDYNNKVLAALGVSVPSMYLSIEQEQFIMEKLKIAASKISEELGYKDVGVSH